MPIRWKYRGGDEMNFTIDEIKLAMFSILVDMGNDDDTDDLILSALQDYITLLETLDKKIKKEGLINAWERE